MPLYVEDLIEHLQTLPPNTEVRVIHATGYGYSGYDTDWVDLELPSGDHTKTDTYRFNETKGLLHLGRHEEKRGSF
jgi:hypothetical protein